MVGIWEPGNPVPQCQLIVFAGYPTIESPGRQLRVSLVAMAQHRPDWSVYFQCAVLL